MMSQLVVAFLLVFAQPATSPSLTFNPASPHATDVHWIVTLSAAYCGGVRIGDGVYIKPEPPLALPATVSPDTVLFDGRPAEVVLQAGVLRVTPSRTLAQSMLCLPRDQPFTVELVGSLGLANPDAGDYAVDVWIGSGSRPQRLPVTIAVPAAAQTSGCDSLHGNIDEAAAVLKADNAAVTRTFDDIRAQAATVTAQAPELASTQAELVARTNSAEAEGEARASEGWNPDIGYASTIGEWAQRDAEAELAGLEQAVNGPDGASRPSVVSVVSVVQLAQLQAQMGVTDSQHLMNALQQLADCHQGEVASQD
jgi:hypothetical protein